MNKKTERHIQITLPVVIILIYTAGWFLISAQINKEILQIYENAAQQNIIITGDKPSISGFPGAHKITFSGAIEYETYSVNIPQAVLKGRSELLLVLPEGISITGMGEESVWSLDYVALKAVITEAMPYELTRYTFNKGDLSVTGTGRLYMDKNQQLAGELQAHITGSLPFLKWLQSKSLLKKDTARMAEMILNGLEKDDPASGQKAIDTVISLKNQALFLGPLRILKIPDFFWDNLYQKTDVP